MACPELNILTVDDELSVNFSIHTALGGPARSLASASDGEDALAQIQASEKPFDLIIIDHKMPRVDGLEFVRRLRETRFAGKIIVLSAHLCHDLRQAYEALRVDVILSKPFDLRELRDAVEQVVRAV